MKVTCITKSHFLKFAQTAAGDFEQWRFLAGPLSIYSGNELNDVHPILSEFANARSDTSSFIRDSGTEHVASYVQEVLSY